MLPRERGDSRAGVLRSATIVTDDASPPTATAAPRDAPLLTRVAAGESDAVQLVLDTYGGLVWSIARRMLGRQSEAEDAVQEIFIELWRSAPRYDPGLGTEAQFITTIARRRLIDRVRKRSRQPDSEPLPDALSSTEDAERDVDVRDAARRAEAALDTLAPDRRRVIRMAILEGHTHTEIAADTGIPLGTVKTHVRRGLIRLRKMLDVVPDDA